VEQKNWAVVRTVVGYHRYDTAAELLLLNKIWLLQSKITNFFLPQQKLTSKILDGAKITKKYDVPTPHRRIDRHENGTGACLSDCLFTHRSIVSQGHKVADIVADPERRIGAGALHASLHLLLVDDERGMSCFSRAALSCAVPPRSRWH